MDQNGVVPWMGDTLSALNHGYSAVGSSFAAAVSIMIQMKFAGKNEDKTR